MQRSFAYRNYLLILLTISLAFNYVDRLALGVVLQDIKTDFKVTDTQLGFLSGVAFAFFYAVMGIPIARWADRGNRVTIITCTCALWSATIALCGAASNFSQLLLIRVGVAVGEAGCVPPAHSLIADHFTRSERPRAVSSYMLGVPLALSFGYFVPGWLNELYGWRGTFFILGMPGLALAALARVTLKDPRRTADSGVHSHSATAPCARVPSFMEVCATLWANVTFRHLLICFSVWYFFGYGVTQWQPTFFIRSHGLRTGELGSWFAVVYGVGAGVGMYLGGELAGRYAAGNERLQLRACSVAFIFFPAVMGYAFLAPNRYLSFGALGVAAVGAIAQGPMLAAMQTLVPARMRAMSIALVYLFANLIGMGLGPLAAGALSDALRPLLGEESLRYALVSLCPGYFWAAWHLWAASRTVARDVAEAQFEEARLARTVRAVTT